MSADVVDGVLDAVRRRLLIRATTRVIAIALIACGVVVVLLLAADGALALPPAVRRTLRWLPVFAVLAPLPLWVRVWTRAQPARLALLVDERAGYGNVLSTYRDMNARGPVAEAFRHRTAATLGSIDAAVVVPLGPDRLWAFAGGLGALALATVITAGGADTVMARWWSVAATGPGGSTAVATVGPEARRLPTLGGIDFTIQPPAYSGLPTTRARAGETLAALPGSVIEIRGSGTARAPGLSVTVAGREARLAPRPSDEGWLVTWTVGAEDRGIALAVMAGEEVLEQRVLPLRLLRDRPPVVTLASPVADMVLGTASGTILIEARVTDDYGVADVRLHWVLSRGSGESFDFDEGEWTWDGVDATDNGRTASLSLGLDTLGLGPGDLLHIRATATDGNTVTGPGLGVSGTRQIRISREDDLSDVTTMIGFPIEREREPLLSQRMIILLTEDLRDGRGAMTREAFLAGARDIAGEQSRLRGRIGEQIFSRATGAMQDPEAHLEFEDGEAEVFLDELEGLVQRGPVIDPVTGIASIANVEIAAHEHDSDPIVAINRTLLTVYNYMWDAERELRAAALDPSLIPQNLALDELQRLRESERVFARGRVTAPPVDVPATRGTGEVDDARPAPRAAVVLGERAGPRVASEIDEWLRADRSLTGRAAAIALSSLALDLLEADLDPEASEILARAAERAEAGDAPGTREGLQRALRLLNATTIRTSEAPSGAPNSFAGARYLEAHAARPGVAARGANGVGTTRPFVFATVRYQSGDWDSAPLVPNNLVHSLVQYTDLVVAPEGVIVDLASRDVFDFPFLYLTGHLPVFFDEAESRNLVDFVERGGFIFIDDHNHDIDGAFHRSVTAELQRLFGSDRLLPVPNDHELYSSFFVFDEGPPITGHELSGWGDGLIHRQLSGIEVGDRIGVLYSNKDYSSEWSYHADNKRFLAIDNTRFGVNILLYALTR